MQQLLAAVIVVLAAVKLPILQRLNDEFGLKLNPFTLIVWIADATQGAPQFLLRMS